MAMTGIEVEVIDDTEGQGSRVDGAGRRYGGVPVLKLRVGFDCQIVGEVVVDADAGGVDEGVGVDVQGVAEDEAGGVIVDLAAAEEEVDVGMELSYRIFDLGSEEEVFLAAD